MYTVITTVPCRSKERASFCLALRVAVLLLTRARKLMPFLQSTKTGILVGFTGIEVLLSLLCVCFVRSLMLAEQFFFIECGSFG